jgi:propanediol dehydratase small subunit
MVRVALAIVVMLAAAGAATATAAPSGVKVSAEGYPLVCGRPTGSLKVVFPAATKLPATIAAKTVTMNTVRAARVSVSGQTVTITAAKPTGIMCHSISLGVLEIAFTRAAHVELGSTRTAKILRATLTLPAKVTPSA